MVFQTINKIVNIILPAIIASFIFFAFLVADNHIFLLLNLIFKVFIFGAIFKILLVLMVTETTYETLKGEIKTFLFTLSFFLPFQFVEKLEYGFYLQYFSLIIFLWIFCLFIRNQDIKFEAEIMSIALINFFANYLLANIYLGKIIIFSLIVLFIVLNYVLVKETNKRSFCLLAFLGILIFYEMPLTLLIIFQKNQDFIGTDRFGMLFAFLLFCLFAFNKFIVKFTFIKKAEAIFNLFMIYVLIVNFNSLLLSKSFEVYEVFAKNTISALSFFLVLMLFKNRINYIKEPKDEIEKSINTLLC